MRNKRGQFYLLAAVVIVALIIGFAGVSNYLNKKNQTKIYDVKEELNIEGKDVLEYGILRGKDVELVLTKDEIKEEPIVGSEAIVKHFITIYNLYLESVGENMNIYYILGNKGSINVYQLVDVSSGSISLSLGDRAPSAYTIITKSIEEIDFKTPDDEGKVNVVISNDDRTQTNYEFNLEEGENFYFIISQEVGGNKYVETN